MNDTTGYPPTILPQPRKLTRDEYAESINLQPGEEIEECNCGEPFCRGWVLAKTNIHAMHNAIIPAKPWLKQEQQ